MTDRPLAAVVLAAGKGTRMRSATAKVLHKVAGRSMIGHVIAAAEALKAGPIVVVVAPGMDTVIKAVAPHPVAAQAEQLGTADAVKAARGALAGLRGRCPDPLRRLSPDPAGNAGRDAGAKARRDSDGAGHPGSRRLALWQAGARPADGSLDRIVEALDASEEERRIDLCNSGVMLIDGALLFDLLDRIGNRNAKGEYYLTDIVGVAQRTRPDLPRRGGAGRGGAWGQFARRTRGRRSRHAVPPAAVSDGERRDPDRPVLGVFQLRHTARA